MTFSRHVISCFALPLLFCSAPSLAQGGDDWSALEVQDLRLARISDRMLVANRALCTQTMPVTGMILHSSDQYREGAAQQRFINGPVAIALLRPGSPAALAGLQEDDAILAIGGVETAAMQASGNGNLREVAFEALTQMDPADPVEITIRRDGEVRDVSFVAEEGCKTLVEIRVGDGPRAQSDGRVIQIRYDFATQMSDDQMAVIFAHELGHTVLEHRRRKEEAGIEIGILGEFGANQQANRQSEVEADRITVHLLANAGYDAAIGPQYWLSDIGQGMSGGITSSFVYQSPTQRAQLLQQEIDLYLPLRHGPTWPGHLLELRDRPFANGQ